VGRARRRVAAQRRLRHKSTLQSATGIRTQKLVQKSMGMSAGFVQHARVLSWRVAGRAEEHEAGLPAAGVRAACVAAGVGNRSAGVLPWLLAVLVQAPGLLAERWFFFAQAKHPQNLYYQVVS
jgi:hypothetical protein